jgi:argininosuccinate lyase
MAKRLWDKGQDVDALVHRFTVGNDPEVDRAIVYWDALASAAHAVMLAEIGVLSTEEKVALLLELKRIADSGARGEFDIPTELEDCHSAIEAKLTELLGEAGKKIHTGRSRNDQVLVAMRLYLRDACTEVLKALSSLATSFQLQGEAIGHVQFAGQTHFQPAMPASMKMWLGAYFEHSIELLRSGVRCYELLDQNPLGVASGFGVPLGLKRDRTTALLGFSMTQRNPIFVQNSRGWEELRLLQFLCEVGGMLEKFAWDGIVYSAHEFQYIRIPEEFTTGSSIMPQKRNPDVLELLRARAGKLRGARAELEAVIAKLPSHYHRDLQYTKEPVFRAVENVLEMLAVAQKVADGLEINEAAAARSLTAEVYATYDTFKRTREGTPFREAYRETAEAIQKGSLEVGALSKEFDRVAAEIDSEYEEAKKEHVDLAAQIVSLCKVPEAIETRLFRE